MAALQGVTGVSDTVKAFVADVRGFIRDWAELNRLVAGEESNERMILWAVADALSNFNGTPPFTDYTLEYLLSRNQHHLLKRMTVEYLLESVGLLQTRNHVNYSDGGINIGVNDKTPLIQSWLQFFKSTTEQKLVKAKVALNIESVLDSYGVPSEYLFTSVSYLGY